VYEGAEASGKHDGAAATGRPEGALAPGSDAGADARRSEPPRGDAAQHPFEASIIIPVHNRADLTRQCLTALAEVTTDVEFEVIIVDNASTDETVDFLGQLAGDVQVIRNAANLGFAAACNQGARAARGRNLVFLNNDTIPQRGWLEALVEEVRTHPEVAVVGSKLLYPDGRIQHAGVAFSRSMFAPYHIYRQFPGDAPAVNYRRELQCVTAACMLIRRDVFEVVGGLDEGYRNGFEDVDLCLKVGEAGWRIVYQPASVLYHLESQTPGRMAHERHNGDRLFARWGDHWWLPDEDAIYFGDGFALRGEDGDGKVRFWLTVLEDEAERRRWETVAEVQRRARRRDVAGIRALLGRVEHWPEEALVLRWAAALCEAVGAPQLAEGFARRLQRATGHPEARDREAAATKAAAPPGP
jgi:GT2 family glycosyltransferase